MVLRSGVRTGTARAQAVICFGAVRAHDYSCSMELEITMLRDFRLVASHGGFGKASRASGRPKATLSKRVNELEENLGVRLFDRSTGRLRLTDEGEKLIVYAEHLVDTVDQIREELGASAVHPRGKLRIAAPAVFSHVWMGRVTAAFLTRFPEVQIEAVIAEPPLDMASEQFDLLIRVNPPPSLDMVGRIIARDGARVVTSSQSRDLLRRELDADRDVVLPAIAPTGIASLGPWSLSYEGRSFQARPVVQLHLPSRTMVRDAILGGFGFAELPASLVLDDIAQGLLIDLGAAPQPEVEVWVLYASRRLVSRRVSAFVAFLCEYFAVTDVRP